ncbi:molybdenum cofactor biosynthesis protein MoaE [Vulgatibacter sp.]|uniref:molybdenum cofactor biosynthesis protein MoaE n=1 Tax=Vulgatibacter sp. TaxID=1971226 RepID=UPI00356310C5
MRITVLYFAAAREAAATDSEIIELAADADVAALLSALGTLHPALLPVLPRCRVAIGHDFAPADATLAPGAEVAIIPPVAGGTAPICRLSEQPLSLDEAVASVRGRDAGAIVTFTGQVREASRGREVVRLDYEAFGPMAEKQLRAIAAECGAKWPGSRVAILHRTGTLEIGAIAVVIAAAAPHRAEAFAACRHAIERLKEEVAIWKKEHFTDGTEWVGLGP